MIFFKQTKCCIEQTQWWWPHSSILEYPHTIFKYNLLLNSIPHKLPKQQEKDSFKLLGFSTNPDEKSSCIFSFCETAAFLFSDRCSTLLFMLRSTDVCCVVVQRATTAIYYASAQNVKICKMCRKCGWTKTLECQNMQRAQPLFGGPLGPFDFGLWPCDLCNVCITS